MTYLSLFGTVDTEHGLVRNDGSNHRRPAQNSNHDLFHQVGNNLMSSGLPTLPHTHQTPLSLQPPASAVSHERTTANHVNHAFFNTPLESSASSSPTTKKPTSGPHAPPRPQSCGSPVSSSSGSGSSKRKRTASPPPDVDPDSEEAQVVIKRQRNTMAARKYRQKRLDRISNLESALGDVTSERDELKLQLARREAEVEALREMLSRK